MTAHKNEDQTGRTDPTLKEQIIMMATEAKAKGIYLSVFSRFQFAGIPSIITDEFIYFPEPWAIINLENYTTSAVEAQRCAFPRLIRIGAIMEVSFLPKDKLK